MAGQQTRTKAFEGGGIGGVRLGADGGHEYSDI